MLPLVKKTLIYISMHHQLITIVFDFETFRTYLAKLKYRKKAKLAFLLIPSTGKWQLCTCSNYLKPLFSRLICFRAENFTNQSCELLLSKIESETTFISPRILIPRKLSHALAGEGKRRSFTQGSRGSEDAGIDN